MTIRTYWQIDATAEPARSEARAWSGVPTLFRDVRAASNRYDYYAQIAQAAAQTAFDGLFLPYRAESDDSQIIAAAIARETPRLALIPEFPAWVGSAVYAAKQAVSFQRLAHERLGWAIAPPADALVRARDADHVPEDQLVERTEEFLNVARGVHGEAVVRCGHRPFLHRGDDAACRPCFREDRRRRCVLWRAAGAGARHRDQVRGWRQARRRGRGGGDDRTVSAAVGQ